MQEVQEKPVPSLGQEDPLEKEMAIHSSILAWISPWTVEPLGLQSTASQRVGHDWAHSTHWLNLRSHHFLFKWLFNVGTWFLYIYQCKNAVSCHIQLAVFLHWVKFVFCSSGKKTQQRMINWGTDTLPVLYGKQTSWLSVLGETKLSLRARNQINTGCAYISQPVHSSWNHGLQWLVFSFLPIKLSA